MFSRRFIFAISHAAIAAHAAAADAPPLPALGADARHTSVSGLSAGAYMAVQIQVAHSASIVGAGVIAGGPYYCAAGDPNFIELCMGHFPFFTPGASPSVGTAKAYAVTHDIDALSHLRKRRLYFFKGSDDKMVTTAAVDSAVDFFRRLGVEEAGIGYVRNVPAGHALIAPDATHACDKTEPPYVNRCEVGGAPYDQPKAVLTQIYGALQPAAVSSTVPLPFNQRLFAGADARMADTGYVYAPQGCSAVGAHCGIHVALHGCVQSKEAVGDAFYAGAGFNRWAETNRLIVLYPQVNKSALNPYGCWDWWGYTGADYAKKSAPQIKAIVAMVKRLTQ